MTQDIISNLIFSIKKFADLNIFDFPESDFVYKERICSWIRLINSFRGKKKYYLKTSTEPELSISCNIQYQWEKIDEDKLKEVISIEY